ncbi:MAG: hypothetical protein IK086_03935 [Clostridia bacterium]|nr:hypothetical protein [Clostridia bacterium]
MKKIIFIIVAAIFIFAFPFSAAAEEERQSIYDISGVEETKGYLSDDARDLIDGENIDVSDYNWINSIETESVFSHIWSFIKSGAKAPLRAGFCALAIIIVAAAARAFGKDGKTDAAVRFAVTLAVCSAVIYGVWGSINTAVNMLKGCSSFMLAFVPVYMGIVSVSGAPATAVSNGAMMLASAEFINAASAFFITSVMGAYLAVALSSSVSPLVNGAGLAETFKRVGTWAMSLCTTVFLGLLGAKSAVNSAADTLSAKTAKFILGTCVPVAGNTLSGAVNTVASSLSLLKSSVGIYGVIAVAAMILPVVAELLLWRLVLNLLSGVCSLFSIDETSKLFKAVDGMLGFLTGAVILAAAMFIIALAATVGAGKLL